MSGHVKHTSEIGSRIVATLSERPAYPTRMTVQGLPNEGRELDTHSSGPLPGVCPFLAFGADAERRSAAPDERHRCHTSQPATAITVDHQARFCLTDGFTTCPVFRGWAASSGAAVSDGPATATLGATAGSRRDRGGSVWLLALAAVLIAIVAAVAFVAPGFLSGDRDGRSGALPTSQTTGTSQDPSADPIPTATPSPEPTTTPSSTATASPSPSPTGGETATAGLTGSPGPTSDPAATAQVYEVAPGDSLCGIAAQFGISGNDLLAANPQVTDPNNILIGDLLTIPAPGAPPAGTPNPDGPTAAC